MRPYRSNNGAALETRVQPDPQLAERLSVLFGSLSAAARMAIEIIETVLESFRYLVDARDEDCPFTEEEIAEMLGQFIRRQILDMRHIEEMSERLSAFVGERFADRCDIERYMIVIHLWLLRWRS